MPKLPSSCITAEIKYSNQGSLKVAPLPAPPPPGGIVVDGQTWTLSNTDSAGWPIEWTLAPGDQIAVLTATGYQVITITTVTDNGDGTTTAVGTLDVVDGILEDDQPTGLWLVTPASYPCPPPTAAAEQGSFTDRGGNVKQYAS